MYNIYNNYLVANGVFFLGSGIRNGTEETQGVENACMWMTLFGLSGRTLLKNSSTCLQQGQTDHQNHCGAGNRAGTLLSWHSLRRREDGNLDSSVYRKSTQHQESNPGIRHLCSIHRGLWGLVVVWLSWLSDSSSQRCPQFDSRQLHASLFTSLYFYLIACYLHDM